MGYKEQLDFAVAKTAESLNTFKYSFPNSQSTFYIYRGIACETWTDGFYTGMLMIAYEYTKDPKFLESAKYHLEMFRHRIDHKLSVDHHDLGFLYSLGAVSLYKVTGDEYAKETALLAADQLLTRYVPKGKFIRAWGPMDSPTGNRLIIDCLLNIPLLFWATEVTGDEKYREVATNHLYTTFDVIVRENGTTHHTFFFDPVTGKPDHGETAQGYSNDSCWARGQAWGVYGAALAYHYTRDEKLFDVFKLLTRTFISRLPEDYVPYWDMDFTDGSGEPRDSSAAPIVACGILEMNKYFDCSEFMPYVEKMLDSLNKNYLSTRLENPSNAILTDAMYSKPQGHVPEANIWGDYYYMEALMRLLNPDWKMYW